MVMRILLCAALLAMSCCGVAQDASSASPFSKTQWVVSGGYCPVGCSSAVAAFIKSQVGTKVVLSSSQLSASFLDKCDGSVHYKYEVMDADRLASDLSQGQVETKRFTRANMQIDSPRVTTAMAFCHSDGSDSTMARILSIEPDRVRILFEEQSIIELH